MYKYENEIAFCLTCSLIEFVDRIRYSADQGR